MLAAVTPFIAGLVTAPLAIAPIGRAIWLVAGSKWSVLTQIVASVLVVGSTLVLVIAFLLLTSWVSSD